MKIASLQDTKQSAKRLVRQLLGKEPYTRVQIQCKKEYHGQDFGRWCICPETIHKDSIVYSFGVGEDVSFDQSIIQKFGVVVYAFDPTPKSIQWVYSKNLEKNFKLHEFGLASYDGTAFFAPPLNPNHVSHRMVDEKHSTASSISVPVFTLQTIMKMLNHQSIDLLKMDIEGAEYLAIDQILASGVSINQILVEVHHRFDTKLIAQTQVMIANLNKQGYFIFNISPSGEEYSFIHKH